MSSKIKRTGALGLNSNGFAFTLKVKGFAEALKDFDVDVEVDNEVELVEGEEVEEEFEEASCDMAALKSNSRDNKFTLDSFQSFVVWSQKWLTKL